MHVVRKTGKPCELYKERTHPGAGAPRSSHNVRLVERLAGDDAVETHAAQVDIDIASLDEQLGHGETDGQRVLNAVPARAARHVEVAAVRMVANDEVLVERVVVVVAGPRALHLFITNQASQGRQRLHVVELNVLCAALHGAPFLHHYHVGEIFFAIALCLTKTNTHPHPSNSDHSL